MLMAVLLSTPAASKEEAVGLAAHLHVVLQIWVADSGSYMIGNLKSGQLLKGLKWGELNLWKCLPWPTLLVPSGPTDLSTGTTPCIFMLLMVATSPS